MFNTAFLFSGQGTQYIGMGKKLCDNFQIARELFEEASDILGFDIKNLCFSGSIDLLTKTENAQPAILATSVAGFKAYMQEMGHEPIYLAGHSLGEISALVCAEGIRFSDAIKIVRRRGEFMNAAVPEGIGAMAAVEGIESEYIIEECKQWVNRDKLVVVSNYNSPSQIVISGHKEAVKEVSEIFTKAGGRVIPLKVSAPFHSPLMQPAAEMLKEELLKYTYYPMKYSVISNVDALPYKDQNCIVENLTKQIVMPVQWSLCMNYLQNHHIDTVIEFGPGEVLKRLALKNNLSLNSFSYDIESDIEKIKNLFPNTNHVKMSKIKLMTRCLAIAVCTPNCNWNNEEYSKGVIEPYKRIQQIVDDLDREGSEPTLEQMEQSLEMLRSVFITKKTAVEEQIERFNQIFDETDTRDLFKSFKMY